MTPEELLAVYDEDQRRTIQYTESRREVTPQVVRYVGLLERRGFIGYSRLSADTADTVIREQIDYFGGMGYEFEWKLFDHDTPGDLKDRLLRHGFEPEEREALCILEIAAAPAILFKPVTLDVRRTHNVEDVMLVQRQVWDIDFDWLAERLNRDVRDTPHQLSLFVAYADGQPVSSAWSYYTDGSQFASLWGGSTLAAYRGRGFYTALLAVRLQEASERGLRFLTVDASPMSRPILEKLGFQVLTYSCPYLWQPGYD